MMRNLLASLVLLLAACTATTRNAVEPRPDADEQQVIATAQRLFDAMAARDQATLQDLLDPNAQIIMIRNGSTRVVDPKEWIAGVASSKALLRERMWSPRVEVGEEIASLWAPYDIHIGENFGHCGIDAFQFVRNGDRWRLVTIAFTARTEGCTGPPAESGAVR